MNKEKILNELKNLSNEIANIAFSERLKNKIDKKTFNNLKHIANKIAILNHYIKKLKEDKQKTLIGRHIK